MYLKKIRTIIPVYWAGFVSAISFFEAWLKFRAEGVSLDIGLRIGKLIFSSLNKVELIFAALSWLLVLIAAQKHKTFTLSLKLLLSTVTLVLLLQTVWLLPQLSARADIIIQGGHPTSSPIHLLYGILEVLKVTCLIVMAFQLINNEQN